jgi:ABC-type glycerol-3-phosphate transport system permease component
MNLLVYLIFSCVLLLFPLMYWLVAKSIKESFLYQERKKRISWKKIGRFYIYCNIFSLVACINNEMMGPIDVILMPIFMISFLIVLKRKWRQIQLNKILE